MVVGEGRLRVTCMFQIEYYLTKSMKVYITSHDVSLCLLKPNQIALNKAEFTLFMLWQLFFGKHLSNLYKLYICKLFMVCCVLSKQLKLNVE